MKMIFAVAVAALAFASPARAQNVKVTPIGSHPGELCYSDRATIFEDPSGVRILYDAGHTVTGPDDPRLGEIHAVLLTHAHGDHIGDRKLKAPGAGSCAAPETVPAGPYSTTAEIANAKNAAIIMQTDMATFIGKKVEQLRGKPTPVCPQSAGATMVPVAAPCRSAVHLGGTWILKSTNAARGVEITVVYASHANNVPLTLLSEPLRSQFASDDTSIVLGPPTGFVVKFTNGLTAYLSGDTGIHTEMKTVVHDFHQPNLAMLNLGPSAISAGPGAYAMNELVRPASVILSHPNEAVTEGGKLRPNSRAAAFIERIKRDTYLAISGRTMEFDGRGRCVAGC